MIKYRVICEQGHAFDAWFASSATFDDQAGRGNVACPTCGSTAVERALMAPAVRSSRRQEEPAAKAPRPADAKPDTAAEGDRQPPAGESGGTPAEADAPVRLARLEAMQKAYLEAVRQVRAHIVANATDVGARFPEEARKIHYGESETRNIYGQASPEEARELVEEGIDVTPFPHLPEDAH